MESDITDISKIKIRLKIDYIIILTGGIYYENEQEGINFGSTLNLVDGLP